MKVVIHKFKTIEDLTLEIPANITGGNGSGKTTILEAISFCLTGKDMSGSEFKQVYDNRQDLHDAIADVSFFDNYGNEYRRIVTPVFQTSRAGVEEIKIKRNTVCKKNDIAVNDFASEFADFYKFGTDYFFRQKEDDQRKIFIDTLKSRMPDYDIHANSLKLKELVKAQKTAVADIELLRELQKNTKDVEVPEISEELQKLNAEYLALSATDNSNAIAEINAKNNAAMDLYLKSKSRISGDILARKEEVGKLALSLQFKNDTLKLVSESAFQKTPQKSTDELENQLKSLSEKLNATPYYEKLEDYAAANFSKNPVLVENQEKIIELSSREFIPSGNISNACPLSGEACETARLHSETSERLAFNSELKAENEKLRAENRGILNKEMEGNNSIYLNLKRQIDNLNREISEISQNNLKILQSEKEAETNFEEKKAADISRLNSEIKTINLEIQRLESEIKKLEDELSNLTQPTPEKLPEEMEISEELKNAHAEFSAIDKNITGAKAINLNNAKKRAENETQIKTNQDLLFELDKKVVKIRAEISEYFSNLTELVRTEFAGAIEIGVELLEFVMSRDEYKDCFRITANGKAFPFECNGALQNNVKLQVLAALQRLNDYTGITIMDNCEANTTQPINICGLPCVLARATDEAKLKIN